jgi:hypothetical protein
MGWETCSTDKNPFKGFLTPDIHIYSGLPNTIALGAFVPSKSPCFQTVPEHTNLLLMATPPAFPAFGRSLHIRLQGLFVGVKAPSLMAVN